MEFSKEFGLLWDIDGVVADSPHEESWRKVAELPEWGIDGLTSDFYLKQVASKPRYEGANCILEQLGGYEKLNATTDEEKQVLLDKYCEQKNDIITNLITNGEFDVFDSSVMIMLEGIKRGMKMGAASASKNANSMLVKINVQEIINRNGGGSYPFIKADTSVYDLFDINVSGKSVPGGKPELFEISAKDINKQTKGVTDKFIVFEDGLSGVEAAKKNGFFAVGIIRIGEHADFVKAGADIIVNDLSEISFDALEKKISALV